MVPVWCPARTDDRPGLLLSVGQIPLCRQQDQGHLTRDLLPAVATDSGVGALGFSRDGLQVAWLSVIDLEMICCSDTPRRGRGIELSGR